MTPALTKKEAKEKCIKMWEHIRDNITDKEWRAAASHFRLICEYKEHAMEEVGTGDSGFLCYLCDVFNNEDAMCVGCPLHGSDTPHRAFRRDCTSEPGPYRTFRSTCVTSHYARASAAANRLVEKVRAWEVGE